MLILGIVGSPRQDGRTNALVGAALEGAASAGAQTHTVYLADYAIRPFTGSGGSSQALTYCPAELSALCEEAAGLVLGAPVYYGDISGLAKDFMDTVRIPNENGKPALGTAIAGGSGKGLLSGVQSIYHWFYHRQMRAIDPTPASRFNMEEALRDLRASGALLASLARDPRPFPGEGREDRWADVLAHYATLPYLDRDPVDEFVLLATQLIAKAAGDKAEQAKAELLQALGLMQAGNRAQAGRHAVRAYELLYYSG